MRRVAIIASASGTLVLEAADTIVWLDLPMRVESLFGHALIQHRRRRREWPARMAAYPVTRLRTPVEVDRWIADV
jgi:hypothetical protein